MRKNIDQRLYHRCEIIFSSSPVMDGFISYDVSVNGVQVHGALGINPDEISLAEIAKQMRTFDSDLYAAVRSAATSAFRAAAAADFLPTKGRFRGELKVGLPGEEGRPKKGYESKETKRKHAREKAKEHKKAIEAIRYLHRNDIRPDNKAKLAEQINLGCKSNRTRALNNWLQLYGFDLQELIREALPQLS